MAGLGEHFLVWFNNLELKVIGPTKDLSETCASSLKTGVHFAHRSESDVPAGILREVKQKIKSSVELMPPSTCVDAIKNSTGCESKIYENSARLLSSESQHSKRIKDEAELRYVLGNPIMRMMCDSGNLKVQLEESVRSSNEEPKVAGATSAGSRADYSCYTIRDNVLAVVIETKMDLSSQDALAQVMGCVAAFRKGDMFPPVAIVVTETLLEVLLFPFVKDNQRLLTAAHLSVNLWKGNLVEPNCLRLLACLSSAKFKEYMIEHSTAKDYEEMRKIVKISTESDSKDEIIERLKAETKEVQAGKELQAKLRKLDAQ